MVADAMRLWKEIPSDRLPEAVDEALIQAGDYPFKIGGVAKAFREPGISKTLELGSGMRHSGAEVLEKMGAFDAHRESLSEEEWKKELEGRLQVCREAGAKLVGGVG